MTMRLEVDPADLRAVAQQLTGAAQQADRARAKVRDVGSPSPWSPDLGVQGAVDRALLCLEQWSTTAASACRELVDSLDAAATGYEATEAALSGRDRRPE